MSPDFKFQLTALLKLCAAIIEHGDESSQANEIRESMDNGSWYRLTDEQQEALRALSARVTDLEEGRLGNLR